MRDVGLLLMKLQFLLTVIKLLRQLKCSEMAIINPSIRQDKLWRGLSSALPHVEGPMAVRAHSPRGGRGQTSGAGTGQRVRSILIEKCFDFCLSVLPHVQMSRQLTGAGVVPSPAPFSLPPCTRLGLWD